jgi:hypothetical protein
MLLIAGRFCSSIPSSFGYSSRPKAPQFTKVPSTWEYQADIRRMRRYVTEKSGSPNSKTPTYPKGAEPNWRIVLLRTVGEKSHLTHPGVSSHGWDRALILFSGGRGYQLDGAARTLERNRHAAVTEIFRDAGFVEITQRRTSHDQFGQASRCTRRQRRCIALWRFHSNSLLKPLPRTGFVNLQESSASAHALSCQACRP